jgi:TPR repeat protein
MFPNTRSAGFTALLVVLSASLVSCADTAREEEIAVLRKQLERAENAAAEAKAMAAEAKAMVERQAAQRVAAAERAAAERAAAERAAAERAAAERAAAERRAAERPKGLSVAPEPAPWGGQALYEQALDLESEGRRAEAVRMYGRAGRSGNGKAALRLGEIYEKGIPGAARDDDDVKSRRWYYLARVLGEDVPESKIGSPGPGEVLYGQALTLESQGRGPEAVKVYARAARSGNSMAALRLGEIYDRGLAGVSRDYAESLKWYNAARVLGEDVPLAKSR